MAEFKDEEKTGLFLHNIIRYNKVDSTNKEAMRLLASGAPHGTVVLAEEQTGGRGRKSRNWFSPPGKGLWFSIILIPDNTPAEKIAPLTAVAATAVKETYKKMGIASVKIKWPNDIIINRRKAGGILAELKTEGGNIKSVILGIGLNINHNPDDFPPEIGDLATSARIETGKESDREEIFHQLLNMLESFYLQFLKEGFSSFRPIWLSDNITIGKKISVRCGENSVIKGEAIDIDTEGALIVKEEDNTIRRITYGEIE